MKKIKKYKYKGKMLTINQIVALPECEVSAVSIYRRVLRMSVEDAMKKNGNRKCRKNKYLYKGKMLTVDELHSLDECKISLGRLYKRIRTMGAERAINRDRRKHVNNEDLNPDDFDLNIDHAIEEFLTAPVVDIIPEDDTVTKVTIEPPAPHTTSHYWIMKSVAERRTNDTFNFKELTK